MKKFIRYWSSALFMFALIFYLSSLPPQDFPQAPFPYADKIVHILLYTTLGFFVCRALTARYRLEVIWSRYRKYLFATVAIALIYGISDEFHQSFTPGRNVEIEDIIADTLGGVLGAGLTVLYRRWVIRLKFQLKTMKART